MTTRYLALNPEVLQALKEDIVLYTIWACGDRIGLVDPDIHPMHNPTWRKNRERKEAEVLEALKEEVAKVRVDFLDL